MKCDDKKVLCLGCAQTCHQNHPVCFLNIPLELKFAKCMCSEIGNIQCKFRSGEKMASLGKPKDFPPMMKPVRLGDNPFGGPPPEIFERMKLVHGGGYAPPKGPR